MLTSDLFVDAAVVPALVWRWISTTGRNVIPLFILAIRGDSFWISGLRLAFCTTVTKTQVSWMSATFLVACQTSRPCTSQIAPMVCTNPVAIVEGLLSEEQALGSNPMMLMLNLSSFFSPPYRRIGSTVFSG